MGNMNWLLPHKVSKSRVDAPGGCAGAAMQEPAMLCVVSKEHLQWKNKIQRYIIKAQCLSGNKTYFLEAI